MFERDLLVAGIAFVLGIVLLWSAVINHERAFQIRTPQYLSEMFGRTTARLIIGLVGVFVIFLGMCILLDRPESNSQIIGPKKLATDLRG